MPRPEKKWTFRSLCRHTAECLRQNAGSPKEYRDKNVGEAEKAHSLPARVWFALVDITWMTEQYLFAQMGCVHVHVYLRRGKALVSEHVLYGTQIGTSLEQMCGKTVAEGVGRNLLLYAGLGGIPLYEHEERDAGQCLSTGS